MSDERRLVEERIFGEFGFVLRWSVLDHWADVEVFEIVGYELDGDDKEEMLSDDVYLVGYVKWDGCTELDMGCPHWCGPSNYIKHCNLLKHIYLKAFELMGREPEEEWSE